jgi:hypothetical protein
MNNWWGSSANTAEIPNFFSKVEQVLLQEINSMSIKISKAKAQRELEEL